MRGYFYPISGVGWCFEEKIFDFYLILAGHSIWPRTLYHGCPLFQAIIRYHDWYPSRLTIQRFSLLRYKDNIDLKLLFFSYLFYLFYYLRNIEFAFWYERFLFLFSLMLPVMMSLPVIIFLNFNVVKLHSCSLNFYVIVV